MLLFWYWILCGLNTPNGCWFFSIWSRKFQISDKRLFEGSSRIDSYFGDVPLNICLTLKWAKYVSEFFSFLIRYESGWYKNLLKPLKIFREQSCQSYNLSRTILFCTSKFSGVLTVIIHSPNHHNIQLLEIWLWQSETKSHCPNQSAFEVYYWTWQTILVLAVKPVKNGD